MPSPVYVGHFSVSRVAVPDDTRLLLSHAASLGPSLALLDSPEWVAFAFGKFASDSTSNPDAIRIAAGHADAQRLNSAILAPIADVLRDHATAAELSPSLPCGQALPEWLARVVEPDKETGLVTVDLLAFVPRLVPTSASENALWMSRFLSAVQRFPADEAGVVVLLRPATRVQCGETNAGSATGSSGVGVSERRSAIASLRRFLDSQWLPSPSANSQKSEQTGPSTNHTSGTGGKSTTVASSNGVQWQDNASERRARSVRYLQECARSGAWWCSVRCFGSTLPIAKRAATLYWSCIGGTAASDSENEAGRSIIRYFDTEEPSPAHHARVWTVGSLTSKSAVTVHDRLRGDKLPIEDVRTIYRCLLSDGIDLVLHACEPPVRRDFAQTTLDESEKYRDQELNRLTGLLPSYAPDMVLPGEREMLVSGDRLSTIFQLPTEQCPAVDVVRGFDYCVVPRSLGESSSVYIGRYLPGGLEATSKEATAGTDRALAARFDIDSLTKHVLIVGATGSGKTTTVVSLLDAVRRSRGSVRIAILEGAKREYRQFREALGIEDRDHFDLMGREGYIAINLFAHPPDVAPETHVSRVSALLEATLEMPPPVPALMKEALTRAYLNYWSEPADSPRRKLHPIRYWLMRSTLQIAEEAGYAGETHDNIVAILRTRVRALALGASGRVLEAGSNAWDDLAHQLVRRNLLMELESIGDRCSRSFIMSLFVLYYRYALETVANQESRKTNAGNSGNALRNLLVLEEAHRIIGKPTNPTQATSTQEDFGNLLGEVRAHGCGIIISDQSPSRLIDDAMRNTNTKFLMRLVSGEDIQASVKGAGLPASAVEDMPTLRMGQAILVTPDMPPTLVKVAQASLKRSTGKAEDVDQVTAFRMLQDDERQSIAAFSAFKKLFSEQGVVKGKEASRSKPNVGIVEALLDYAPNKDAWDEALREASSIVGCSCSSIPNTRDSICPAHAKGLIDLAIAILLARTPVDPSSSRSLDNDAVPVEPSPTPAEILKKFSEDQSAVRKGTT